jgi:hypothetical protein
VRWFAGTAVTALGRKFTMTSKVILLMCAPVAALFSRGSKPVGEPPSACEVLSHPQEYIGVQLKFEGILQVFEHASFLRVYSNCPEGVMIVEGQGFSPAAYYKAGGSKGAGVLATVQGKIVISKKRQQPVFLVSSASDMRKLPPNAK